MSRAQPATPLTGNPFDLGAEDAYRRWRARELAGYPGSADKILVAVDDPARPSRAELEAILSRIRRANMALYAARRCDPGAEAAKRLVRALGARLGLRRLDAGPCADDDAITPPRAVEGGARARFIPYGNRAINWHTDGYCNPAGRRIGGFVLHCVCDAQCGGETRAMDHEMAYILLRDENPDFVAALSHARSGFRDGGGQRRLVYRARYHDRIADAAPVRGEDVEAKR